LKNPLHGRLSLARHFIEGETTLTTVKTTSSAAGTTPADSRAPRGYAAGKRKLF